MSEPPGRRAWEEGPEVYDRAVVRALRAEERQRQHTRIHDLLIGEALRAEEQAAAQGGLRSRAGRQAAALRLAAERIALSEPAPGELWSQVVDQDSVMAFRYDPPEEEDPLPVRLVVNDSAELVSATAYLSLEDAEQHGRDVLSLVESIRAERARREAAS